MSEKKKFAHKWDKCLSKDKCVFCHSFNGVPVCMVDYVQSCGKAATMTNEERKQTGVLAPRAE